MTDKKFASGTVSGDPLESLPIGSKINFARVDFGGSDAKELPTTIKNWECFKGSILGVGLKSEKDHEVLGTAVMIAPGLALSATHNFSEALEQMKRGEVIPYCYGVRDSGLEIWRATNISYDQNDDISFLSVVPESKLPEDATYHQLSLTTRMPEVGEKLHIVGFRSSSKSSNVTEKGYETHAGLYTSNGVVSAVYPDGRDRILLPFPAIELNCGSLGGMSGGAAIDSNGHVVGIISRGYQTLEGDGPTYVSWPIKSLKRQLTLSWPPGFYGEQTTPLGIDPSVLFIDGRNSLIEDDGS